MTLHTKLSYVKSGVRLMGYALLFVNITFAAIVLIVSELIGVAEELPGTYKGTKTNAE